MIRKANDIEKWGLFEASFKADFSGNPFTDVKFSVTFSNEDSKEEILGFYDGKQCYRVRFSPNKLGTWTFITNSNVDELKCHKGSFKCVEAKVDNHGPVSVHNQFHFKYADGQSFYPVGTTCYAWTHQGDELEEQTLKTLKDAPFNKVRMCVFPKRMEYNHNEPEFYPYCKDSNGEWDFTIFNPEFFTHFEKRINDLLDLGIEADVILFHPYDKGHWGFDSMGLANDIFYLKYIISRLGAYRNVWWSLANEYDLVKSKSIEDWDALGNTIGQEDPYRRLASAHNWGTPYDYNKSWVTHCSYQTPVTSRGLEEIHGIRDKFKKATIVDECLYEGNIEMRWGDITGQEMVHRFWLGTVAGCYVTHGETYTHKDDILWWSKGGLLHGESQKRIEFLRKILEEGPSGGVEPIKPWPIWRQLTAGVENEYYILYTSFHQPTFVSLKLPEGISFEGHIIDTWNMTISPLNKVYEGKCMVEMPGKPYVALRLKRIK